MNSCSRLAVLTILLLAGVAHSQPRPLRFEKSIGVGWPTGVVWRNGGFGWMSFVSFSQDGAMIASDGPAAPDDVSGNLTLWTFPGGRFVRQLPVRAYLLSGDWRYYATFHEVGEIQSARKVVSLPEQEYVAFAFSPDSRYVAEAALPDKGARGASIRVLELATGKQVNAFGKYRSSSIAISPDGQTLAAGYWDIVMLWNMLTGERVATLRGFGRYVSSLSFSPDGERLAAGTDTGAVQIWDVRRRTRVQIFELGGQFVSTPAFSPDGRLLAVGVYGTGTVWLVETATGVVLGHQQVSDIGCGSAAFSPDGHFLITPSTGGLIRWPYDRGGTIRVFRVGAY